MNAASSLESAHAAFARLALFVDGEWVAGSGSGEDVLDPSTGAPLGRLPHAGESGLAAATRAAARGFAAWSRTPPAERRRVLLEAARLLRERAEHIAHVMTLEEGKPLAESRAELASAIDIFEWYAEESRRLYGRLVPARQRGVRQQVTAEPVGPVAAFTPWNFPALTPARKIAGALAAGCSLVLKAAEETPATAIELARACADAGLPKGVLNLVFGVPSEVSEFLLRQPAIRKVSFTGSIPVGKRLAALAAEHGLKRCTLELGGHGPVIVMDDADAAQAAAACAAGRFRNAGQVCVAPSRFYVQRAAYPAFVERFAEAAAALRVGPGTDPASGMGPLASERRVRAMHGFVEDALARGARLAAGGRRLERPGFFFEPTVLEGVPDEALAMSDEIFGPVAPVAAFDTLEEALARANRLPFGLAAYAFTRDPARAAALSEGLDAGMVGLNHFAVSLAEAPFGGVKESGYGSEGGAEGLDAYLATKFVTQAA